MKNIVIITFLLVSTVSFSQIDSISADEIELVNQINQLRTNPKSYIPHVEDYIKRQEWFIRLYTQKGCKVQAKSTSSHVNKNNDGYGGVTISGIAMFKRNVDVAKTLIKILDTIKPSQALIINGDMYTITKNHLKYLNGVNKVGHFGKDSTTLDDRMKSVALKNNFKSYGENCMGNIDAGDPITKSLTYLLIDAGSDVINKKNGFGHRDNLLSKKWKYISVAINNGTWVQNFAY